MEEDFYTLLSTHAPLIALVSDRIDPSAFAQGNADPCIRYQKIAGGPGIHHRGSDGLSTDTVQIDVRARSAVSAGAVRDALIALLHPFRGTVGGTDFRLIYLPDGGDRGVRHEKPADVEFYIATLDFRIQSRAAASS